MSTEFVIESPLLIAALDYASRGWHVIPIHHVRIGPRGTSCTCGRADCGSPGKHPRTENGLSEASTDEAMIREWWRRWPNANVAIVTGSISGLVVIDVDPDKGGNESLGELCDEFGQFPETVEARTGGGGLHILLAHPGGGRRVRNSRGDTGWLGRPGLDVRGDGGYVVAAPSIHASGERYAWRDGCAPGQVGVAAAPDWLLSLHDTPTKAVQAPIRAFPIDAAERCRRYLEKIPDAISGQGGHDVTLRASCECFRFGLTESQAWDVLSWFNASKCRPEWSERELRHKLSEGRKLVDAEGRFGARLRDGNESADWPVGSPARSIWSPKVRAAPQRQDANDDAAVPGDAADRSPAPMETVADAATELHEHLKGIIAGRIYNVPLPWEMTTRLTQPLLPGCSLIVCGDPGVGKTFWVLQCLRFWDANGYEPVVFFVEKDRKFHTMRLLAQLEGRGCFVDHDWLRANGPEVEAAMERHRGTIEALGKLIWSAPLERVTLQSLLSWIRQMASAGKRVIVIDPITAVKAGEKRWIDDEDFMLGAQQVIAAHGASLVLVTHPRKGNRPGAPTAHDQAMGAAYFKFSDTDFWLHKAKRPRKVQVQTRVGATVSMKTELFTLFHKTRNGKGAGLEIANTFGHGLEFAEQGIVLRDVPEQDEAGEAA